MEFFPISPHRALEMALIFFTGPISHLYLHHQPMPGWFNQNVFLLQVLMSHLLAVNPATPFDQWFHQAYDVYLGLWQR